MFLHIRRYSEILEMHMEGEGSEERVSHLYKGTTCISKNAINAYRAHPPWAAGIHCTSVTCVWQETITFASVGSGILR
ncbi:hypothetical protein KSX_32210 [Ktedonospora formicarum]|uniref:Uncharacterized protein n=1 Tax=Ktedonospora formicarum TaxID=2778364 RepID=A0A8J3MSX2_9CHLR|nr:hypothetical protein KSX_32210 [Ktedonospora formicarum]